MLWVLRHGRSLANEAGVVVSRLENGVLDKYALAPEGVLQAAAAGQALAAALHEAGLTAADVRLVASPFSRTLQTARAVATQLGLPESAVEAEDALRERFFGTPAELGDHSAYEGVWAADAADPTSQPGGDGESVVQVAARLRGCLTRLAGGAAQPLLRTQTGALVLVAHGDTLQILQALLEQEAHALGETGLLATHRRFSMATGELRRVC